jgi:cardiolipin synthase
VGGDGAGAVGTRIWTIPNVLSMLRLALVPPFLVFIVLGDYVAALVILIVASFTDLLDGYLARRLGQVTRLGQLLDPAADRLSCSASRSPWSSP